MKTRTFSILFVVLVTVCLTAGTALAGVSEPTLTVTLSGTTVTVSWTSVASATGYTLNYAPSPYTPHSGKVFAKPLFLAGFR